MKIYKIAMANRWIPKITDPENQLSFAFSCVGASEQEQELLECMDNNNDWQPNSKTQRFLERQVGAMKDDYALSFKYCLYHGEPYVAAYFSSIHYVFAVSQ